MGTAFSGESKSDEVQDEARSSVPSSTINSETKQLVDTAHPRSQDASKQAFAKVAAAEDSEKGNILSAALASAEVQADINLAQFFDALESRCETDEERDALKKLVNHRKEEQKRWKLAQSGQDPNSMPFPTGEKFVPPTVPASSLEWWAGLPSAGGPRDVNEKIFPLRHFEAKGESDQATQEEVPTDVESLRGDMIQEKGGWVNDDLVDGEVVNNKDLSWICTPPIQAMTEDEVKFLNTFWERRGLGAEKQELDFNTELEATGAWSPVEPLDNVILNDITTEEQEAVIKLRQSRGVISDEVRQRRVKLLAQHFAEREQKKQEARSQQSGCRSTQAASISSKLEPVVPATSFFEERLDVATEETTKAQQAKRLAEHQAVIDARAEEGSKYTSFGSPSKSQSRENSFPFTSPEAKAKVDEIIARREKERGEAAPQRSAPEPPMQDNQTAMPPQPPVQES